jgi:hypothetical protein
VHRTHVEHAAAAAGGDHGAHGRAGGEEGAVHVDGHQALPVFVLEVDQRADDLDAGIADQHVEPAPSGHGGGHAGIDLRFVGDVHHHGHGGAASGVDFGRCGQAGVEREVGDADLGAFAGKLQRDFFANAAGGAGDQGDFVFELHGVCLQVGER